MDNSLPGDRAIVKRLPQRAAYDRATIDRILDEGLICHVGFTIDGQPFVIPTIYVRIGEGVYLHGSPASRMLQSLKEGAAACIAVTIVDGLVLARSAFHHSMNYRSVVLFGIAHKIDEEKKKTRALRVISEHVIPGRWEEVRAPAEKELNATTVLEFCIEEASAKLRNG